MKKLISILTIGLIFTPITSQLAACSVEQADIDFNNTNPLSIGKGIDKSTVQNTSGEYKWGVSNFYTIGDSLSDDGGLAMLFSDMFKKAGLTSEGDSLTLTLNGNAYGSDGVTDDGYNSFTNGQVAASVIADDLGLETFKAGSMSIGNYSQDIPPGKNYAVGGATAGKISGSLASGATVDIQAEALISQHIIHENDVVLFEIGGNDLMSMFKMTEQSEIDSFMKSAMEGIRNTFFTLLNNGVKHIIFMTPPNLTLIPRYYADSEEQKQNIEVISNKFVKQINDIIDETNKYYAGAVQVYDMYNRFDDLQQTWLNTFESEQEKLIAEKNLHTSYSDIEQQMYLSINGLERIEFNGKINPEVVQYFINAMNDANNNGVKGSLDVKIDVESTSEKTDNIKYFFFADTVHPTGAVHKIFAEQVIDEFFINNLKGEL